MQGAPLNPPPSWPDKRRTETGFLLNAMKISGHIPVFSRHVDINIAVVLGVACIPSK